MPAYFCTKTHERIEAPGLCVVCDPENGSALLAPAPIDSEPVAAPEPAKEPAPTKKPGDGRNK